MKKCFIKSIIKRFCIIFISFFIFINISNYSICAEINDLDMNTKKILFNVKYTRNVLYNLLGIEVTAETFLPEEIEYDGVVYLTFDDGPVSTITPQILDILKDNEVPATFFCLGEYVNRNKEITQRAYEEGHTIASHTYTHKKAMFSSLETFKTEIAKTADAIEEAVGEKPKFFRVPYGTKLNQSYKDYLEKEGYQTIGWNCESNDSRSGKITPEYVLQSVKDTMKNKKEVTVIMHDTYGKQHTVDALQDVIDYFKSINYEFKKYE